VYRIQETKNGHKSRALELCTGYRKPKMVFKKKKKKSCSVADLRCLSRIPEPNFFISYSGSGSATKNLSVFNPKKLLLSSRKYDPKCLYRIRNFFHPGSVSRGQYWFGKYYRCWILDPAPQHWMVSLKG
jgi:hypothetical protein